MAKKVPSNCHNQVRMIMSHEELLSFIEQLQWHATFGGDLSHYIRFNHGTRTVKVETYNGPFTEEAVED